MANLSHLDMLNRGVSAWNSWQRKNFRVDADLSGVNLSSSALQEAVLYRANLSNSILRDIDLSGANLRKAKLINAVLTGSDLRDAELEGAWLDGADLNSVRNLQQTQINVALGNRATRLPEGLKAPVHWMDYHEALSVGVSAANEWRTKRPDVMLDLSHMNFGGGDLHGINFRKAKLINAVLTGSDLRDAELEGAWLDGADLSSVRNLQQTQIDVAFGNRATRLPEGLKTPVHWMDYHEALSLGVSAANEWRTKRPDVMLDLSHMNFVAGDLHGINFSRCNLTRCDLKRTNLMFADLRFATLDHALLIGAKVLGVEVSSTDLSKVKGLRQAQIAVMIGDTKTRLPRTCQRPASWRDPPQQQQHHHQQQQQQGVTQVTGPKFGLQIQNPALSFKAMTELRNEGAGLDSVAPEQARTDIVDCSVFAPPATPPGNSIRVQVFLHLDSEISRISGEAEKRDRSAINAGRATLKCQVALGERIDLHLDGDGLEIVGEPQRWIVWWGRSTAETFVLRLPRDAEGRQYFPKVTVFRCGAPVGHVTFEVRCSRDAENVMAELRGENSRRYQRVFFSYSQKDQEKVVLLARGYTLIEQKFFLDVLGLSPGQRWKQKLYERISEADLFMLFWSKAARASKWVRKEVEYALTKEKDQGRPTFMPFPLEGPPPPKPWPLLADRHIGDPTYYRIPRSDEVVRR
jgi:uncharacterized protein YjbI with pentapeptide repeats